MHYNTDFRYDLKRGQQAEKWLGGLLTCDTIEVKRDYIASKTKRVYVEYECNGKPSGITTTEADYWAFITDDCVIMIPSDRLKELVEAAVEKKRYRKGGDGNRSLGALIDLRELVEFKE
jgi:hypothetical protein